MQNLEGIHEFQRLSQARTLSDMYLALERFAARLNGPMDDGGWPGLNAACVHSRGRPIFRVNCVRCGQRYDVERIDAEPLFHCLICR